MDEKRTSYITEETEDKAALEAAADNSAQTEETANENINEKIPYIVTLSKVYDLEGKEIKEVDLSGLEDLTTADGFKYIQCFY